MTSLFYKYDMGTTVVSPAPLLPPYVAILAPPTTARRPVRPLAVLRCRRACMRAVGLGLADSWFAEVSESRRVALGRERQRERVRFLSVSAGRRRCVQYWLWFEQWRPLSYRSVLSHVQCTYSERARELAGCCGWFLCVT